MPPVTAAIEERIRELRELGLSYRGIAAHLNRKRVPPPRAETWNAMTIRNIYVRSTS